MSPVMVTQILTQKCVVCVAANTYPRFCFALQQYMSKKVKRIALINFKKISRERLSRSSRLESTEYLETQSTQIGRKG